MEFSIFSTVAALIVAAALTWLVLRFFFGTQKATAGAMDASGERQSATITVKGGYSPAVVSMRAGTPITLAFDRQETGECTSHVVFADLGLDAMLPGNATTDVELPALPPGEYPFACGMNMVHGMLKVEGEDGLDENTPLPHPDASYTAPTAVDAAEADRREATERANEIKALTKLVIVGAVLTLPVFAVTMLHMANPTLVPHWMVNPWLQAILITPVMFYCGRPIHTVGFPALAHRSPDMNSLVSLGTSAAYLYSLVTCIAPWVFPEGSREPYFESVGVVITLVLVGRLLETKAREGTGKAVQSLIKLRPRTAHKLNATSADNVDGIEWRNPAYFTDTDIDAIATGDLLVVKNGERVPTDGIIVDGEAHIDESMITGESKPVSKTVGDPVTGATVLLKGDCVMRATQVGADTVLSQIAAMVARAQATKAPVQQLADKIARYFVPAVMIIAIWTFAIWVSLGPVPCTTLPISLPSVLPGPRSTIHSLAGSAALNSALTRAFQSTWLSSTSSASARVRSWSKPQAPAQDTVCSTASAMSGEWKGRVTSRYSRVGLNTVPPWSFCSRSLAWCLCSRSASRASAARSSG